MAEYLKPELITNEIMKDTILNEDVANIITEYVCLDYSPINNCDWKIVYARVIVKYIKEADLSYMFDKLGWLDREIIDYKCGLEHSDVIPMLTLLSMGTFPIYVEARYSQLNKKYDNFIDERMYYKPMLRYFSDLSYATRLEAVRYWKRNHWRYLKFWKIDNLLYILNKSDYKINEQLFRDSIEAIKNIVYFDYFCVDLEVDLKF